MAAGHGGAKIGQASGDNRSQVSRPINPNLHESSPADSRNGQRRERLLRLQHSKSYVRSAQELATHGRYMYLRKRREQLVQSSGYEHRKGSERGVG